MLFSCKLLLSCRVVISSFLFHCRYHFLVLQLPKNCFLIVLCVFFLGVIPHHDLPELIRKSVVLFIKFHFMKHALKDCLAIPIYFYLSLYNLVGYFKWFSHNLLLSYYSKHHLFNFLISCRCSQWRIQVVWEPGILVWAPKLWHPKKVF